MKKLKLLPLAVGFCLLALAGSAQDKKKVLALPDQERGYYVFFKSKPQLNYETLGHEQIKLVAFSTSECENRIFKRVKEYPEANALIFTGLSYCECEVIKIED